MFKRSKSIKEIYDATKHFGLVITNDPALATGLNRMVDHPRLGTFALTPRQIAARFGALAVEKLYTPARIIAELSRKKKMPVRMIDSSVAKIFEIWRNTGLLESCELYLQREEAELAAEMKNFPSVELMMEEFDESFYGDLKVCVLGRELFNLLDLQVIPKKRPFEEETLFTGEYSFPVDRTFTFPTANDMVNLVVDCISREIENSVSIVMSFNSPYLSTLKSRLKCKGINIIENSLLSQDSGTRDFMKLLEMSFLQDELLVRDVKQLSSLKDLNIADTYDDWLFDSYVSYNKDDKASALVSALIRSLRGSSYSDAIATVQSRLGLEIDANFFSLTEMLGLEKKRITEENYNDLYYFVRFIDIETGKCGDGVLFANSLNSVYVNRDIVFYLGMDAGWTKRVGDLEYIDKKEEERKNLDKFQILLSQGIQRYYFTHLVTGGDETIPCHYFNILIDKAISGFEAPEFGKVLPAISSHSENAAERLCPGGVRDEIMIKMISQSSLSRFYACPKRYAYYRLQPPIENPAMKRGTLIHNFAEFCFDYPDLCERKFDEILELLLGEFESYLRKDEVKEESGIFRIAMKQIISFIKGLEVERQKETGTGKLDNILYKHFRKKKLYGNTEQWFKDVLLGITGRIDLVGNGTIYDFKSSGKRPPSAIVKSSVLSMLKKKKSPEADFQTPMYLLHMKRSGDANESPAFSYLYPLDSKSDYILGKEVGMSHSTIRFIPMTLSAYMLSSEMFEIACEKSKAAAKLSHGQWKEFVKEFSKRLDSGEEVHEDVGKQFYKLITTDLGFTPGHFNRKTDKTFYENEIKTVASLFKDIRTPRGKDGLIFLNDIKETEDYIKGALNEMNEFAATDFPNRPAFDKRKVCNKCDYLGICTGNKLWEGTNDDSTDPDEEDHYNNN